MYWSCANGRSSVALLSATICAVVCAVMASSASADYSDHPKAPQLIEQLVAEGVEREAVVVALRKANSNPRILASMAGAAEKTKTWTAYRASFIKPLRVSQGVDFLVRHQRIFDQVEQRYGVPREMITAILGVETNYGGYTGRANVLDALATLAFEHPRRSPFFMSELKEYILLCREKGWPVDQQLGSYAGAMGMSQFMPSNYRRLAVDGSGDGVIDLFNVDDAIYSVANYFVEHGWVSGEPVASRASVSVDFDGALIGRRLRPNSTVAALDSAGFHAQEKVSPAQSARVLRFNDADGDEFWLGYQNFYVISRYNPRAKYAMAVYHLSEEIARQASAASSRVQ